MIRQFHMFSILDDDHDNMLEVSAIHNDSGYKHIREALSNQYNIGFLVPEIQVAKGGVDLWGDRSLSLQHIMRGRKPLEGEQALDTMKHTRKLWGYDVRLSSINPTDEKIKALYEITGQKGTLDVFVD